MFWNKAKSAPELTPEQQLLLNEESFKTLDPGQVWRNPVKKTQIVILKTYEDKGSLVIAPGDDRAIYVDKAFELRNWMLEVALKYSPNRTGVWPYHMARSDQWLIEEWVSKYSGKHHSLLLGMIDERRNDIYRATGDKAANALMDKFNL